MYAKPFLTFEQQLALLQSRGLSVGDTQKAREVLATLNYYRFSGYAIPFMENREKFKEGAVFEHILQAVHLDEKLRDHLATALEWIEIDFRTTLAHEHARRHGAVGYMDSRNFDNPQKHAEFMAKADEILNPADSRGGEIFIWHLGQKYGEVPLWALVEVLQFGNVVHMYWNMRKQDKPLVARRYKLQGDILGSYIKHLLVVRNMCAHHARFWDKTLYGFRPFAGLPAVDWSSIDTRRVFYTFLLVHRMARHVAESCFDLEKWRSELLALLLEFQKLPHCSPFKIMGIPENGLDAKWWV